VRHLIISDIHSNLAALAAVLNDADSFDTIWCMGDLVGYGPDPNQCVAAIQEFEHIAVAGNHDWAALGKLSLQNFNIDARLANSWTYDELTAASRHYLESLPKVILQDDFTLTHGSPREPIWEYILDNDQAAANSDFFDTSVCLVGHTHIPVAFIYDEEQERYRSLVPPFPGPLHLDGTRMILNPGSVGQPRDGDPRASYAILDSDSSTWEYRRVAYSIEITQERMRARNLPRRLVERLDAGR
jgi:predicted phosphodiesterase